MAQLDGPRSNGAPENTTDQGTASGSLREAFPGHFRPTAEEFDRMWSEGMVVLDTNVLLNLYRYSPSTRAELLTVLLALEDKLFLPHQVGQEFLDRRLTTIRTQREKVSKLRVRVMGIHGEMETELRKVLRLRSGEDLPEGLRDALQEVPPGGYGALSERLEALEQELPRASNTPDDDEVWTAVAGLVNGKVGPSYLEEDLRKAEEEAERRRNAKVPPGFKDQRPGDYLLWRQTIDEAKRSRRPVVLVTDDRKEDWWWIDQGETIGPRRELIAEMRKEAGIPFYMYTPDRLMREARERLDVEVSDESISEAEGLGRETDDLSTSETWSRWRKLDESHDLLESLTEDERNALSEYIEHGRSIDSIAEELGLSHAAASNLVTYLLDMLGVTIIEQPPRSLSDREPRNVRRLSGRRNRSMRIPQAFVDSVGAWVEGDASNIFAFNRMLSRHPEIETVTPEFSDLTDGETVMRVSFRSPVPIEHAESIVEATAEYADIAVATMTFGYPEA